MPTSTAGTFSNRRARGFTLIELVVVLVILSAIALLVFPRLPAADARALVDSAGEIAAAIRFLDDRGSAEGTPYRLRLDIGANRVEALKGAPPSAAPADPSFNGNLLRDGIVIQDILTGRGEKLTEGEVSMLFGPGGLQEFVAIHLKNSREQVYTIMAVPRNGKVMVEEGYRETALEVTPDMMPEKKQ